MNTYYKIEIKSGLVPYHVEYVDNEGLDKSRFKHSPRHMVKALPVAEQAKRGK